MERPKWYGPLAVVLTALSFSLAALLVSTYNTRQSERKWCYLLTTLDDAYQETPPQTVPGQNIAKAIGDLRMGYSCPAR